MSLENLVKDANPVYWLAGVVAAIVGATITVDSRYAKAADVTTSQVQLEKKIESQRAFTEMGFLKQRKSQIEDKVFELEAKREARKITEVELKQLLRYQAELEDINRELRRR